MDNLQTINVTVPIPETHIIISKVEYQELIDNKPINMTLTEVAEAYLTTKAWIVDNIIKDDYFKRKIAPFSQFPNPDGKGKYLFNRKKMRQFLEDYDEEIKERAKKKF
ncbi:DUF771 domain-containing protein [Staphylococcus xylosus]|uniref:DUF771 domain-containing protein n=1 Tax=Staphylococcus xylosus TaxID=1288 RepID=UPI003CEE03FD